MMWNVLNLVLGLVLLMFFLPTVESKECDTIETVVGVPGMELDFNFSISNLRDKYKTYLTERYGKKIKQDEIQIQDLRKDSVIRFKIKMDSGIEDIIYRNGNPTKWAGNQTEIFMTNDTFVVKKTKLQKEDAGIYLIEFRDIRLGQKTLVVTDKPKITRRSPPNPVLKPEHNYTSTIQLECHSVSTSIGDCQLSMYTVWYKNGMRMTDVDPTLSQINVTVDHNGGNFLCLATDYLPCYQRLNTKHYDNVLQIEECNNIFESETFIVQPEYPPIDVKLEPDQSEITVNKNEDMKVSCSANCHPQCELRWEKDYQGINSTSFITENMIRRDLEIENVNNSHEGVYVCLVKNIHGEVKKNFTLRVGGTWDKEQKNMNLYLLFVGVAVFVIVLIIVSAVIVLVIVFFQNKRRKKRKKKKLESIEEGISIDMEEEKKKMLEFIEERELKKMEEPEKMLESIEEGESIKMEEPEKMLESIEERESIKIEEVKNKKMEESIEKRESIKMEVLMTMIENFFDRESIKMEERKKKMLECVEKREPKITEEQKKMVLEKFEKKEHEKMEERKKMVWEKFEKKEHEKMEEEKKKVLENIKDRELKKMEEVLREMLEFIEEEELIKMKEPKPLRF